MLVLALVVVAGVELGPARFSPVVNVGVEVEAPVTLREDVAPSSPTLLLDAVAIGLFAVDVDAAVLDGAEMVGMGLCEKGQSALLASHSPFA